MRKLSLLLLPVYLSACGLAAEPTDTANAPKETPAREVLAKVAHDPDPTVMAGEPVETKQSTLSPNWIVNPDDSSVSFLAEQQGQSFEGLFAGFNASISLDPDYTESAVVKAVVSTGSVDAGDRDRNSILPTKDWFYVKKFPEAVFYSESVARLEDGSYAATGDLTLKGMTRSIVLPFSLDVTGNQAHAVGEFTLDRSDFNVGEGSYATDEWIDFKVTVRIDVFATKSDVKTD